MTGGADGRSGSGRWRDWLHLLTFPIAAGALLWRPLLTGEALLPGRLLPYLLPWRDAAPTATLQAIPWNPLLWDAMAQFYPWRLFAAHSVTHGQIPLWNPYQFCGTPFLANSQSAPLYPLHLLYYLPHGAGVAQRMGWVAAVHVALAGVFTCLWAQSLGARRGPAALAGVLFIGSGFVTAWLELPSFLSAGCWIPLLLLAVGNAVHERSWRWTLVAGGALGLMLLGGHLQIAFYGLLAAAAFAFWATLVPRRRQKGVRPAALGHRLAFLLAAGVTAGGLGAGLAAAQVLPSVELSRHSHRTGAPTPAGYAAYDGYAMPVPALVTLIAPDYFGHPLHGDYHGFSRDGHLANYAEYAAHVAAPGLGLAVAGALAAWTIEWDAIFLAAGAAVALAMSMGGWPDRLLYFHVPGFSQSGSPGRVLVLFCLFASVLAGLGAEAVLRALDSADRRERERVVRAVVAAGVSLGALYALLDWFARPFAERQAATLARVPGFASAASASAASEGAVLLGWILLVGGVGIPAAALAVWSNGRLRRAPALAITAGFVLAATAIDLATFGAAYNPVAPADAIYPRTELTERLAALGAGRVAAVNNDWSLPRPPIAVFPPNSALAYGLVGAQGYDSLFLGRYKQLVQAGLGGVDPSPAENGNIVFLRRADPALARLLAVHWLLTLGAPASPALRVAGEEDGVVISEVRDAVPVARFAHRIVTAPDGRALPAMVAAAHEGGGAVAETAWLPPGTPVPSIPAGETGPVAWRITGPGRREMDVAGGAGGLLLVTENFAPGWRAVWLPAGGMPRELPVLRANVTFQGVVVPPGAGTVLLRYEPATFRAGLFLMLLTAGIMVAALLGRSRGHRT